MRSWVGGGSFGGGAVWSVYMKEVGKGGVDHWREIRSKGAKRLLYWSD